MRGVAKIETFVPTTRRDEERTGNDGLSFSRFEKCAGRALRGDYGCHSIFHLHLHDGQKMAILLPYFEPPLKFAADFTWDAENEFGGRTFATRDRSVAEELYHSRTLDRLTVPILLQQQDASARGFDIKLDWVKQAEYADRDDHFQSL